MKLRGMILLVLMLVGPPVYGQVSPGLIQPGQLLGNFGAQPAPASPVCLLQSCGALPLGISIAPPANTLAQGLTITQSSPTSGDTLGPQSYNLITVTDGGNRLHDGGITLDSYGVSSVLSSAFRINATYSGGEPPIRVGGAFVAKFVGTASTSAEIVPLFGSGYSNTQLAAIWGVIGQASFGPTGQGVLIPVTGEVGAEAGATLTKRMAFLAQNHAPVQGSAIDAALVLASQTDTRGAAAGFKNVITIANNFFPGGVPALDPTGNFFNADSATTIANWAKMDNVTVTGNIFQFPNFIVTGAGKVGVAGATPGANALAVTGSVQLTSPIVIINGVANPFFGISGNTDGTTNATVFQIANSTAAVQLVALANEPSRTTVRWGLTLGNWAEIFDNGSASTNGLIIGEAQNKPIVFGTNNAERARIAGSGCVSIGTTVDCGSPGILNLLTGLRIGNAAASGNILRGDGTNFVSVTPSQLTIGTHLTGSSFNGSAPVTIATDATAANTASTIMARDGSGQVAATTFTGALAGNATSATGIGVTDDNATNATMNIAWFTSNTGNLPAKVSSSKLSFNPSTGGLNVAGNVLSPIYYGGSSAGSTALLNGTSNGSPASAFVNIQSNGQFASIGNTSPKTYLDINENLSSSPALILATSLLKVQAADGVNGGQEWVTYQNAVSNIGNQLSGGCAGGTAASPTASGTGGIQCHMFNLKGWGYNSGWQVGGLIIIQNSETWSAGHQGTSIQFQTTPNATTTPAAAMTIQNSGCLSVGTVTDCGIGSIIASKFVQSGAVAVGSLPTCNAAAKAARHFVTDANAAFTAGIGAVVAAGGANNVPVTCDGTNWRIGANDNIPTHLVRKYA